MRAAQGKPDWRMVTHHDSGYKQLFSHPEMVRDLLAGFVPLPWVAGLDLAAFERVNASYVSDAGEQRHDDMVWRLRIGGDWVYLYLLLEFQSRSDNWMALRMQVYVGLLLQDLLRQHQLTASGKLPPVLPVVLYNGVKPWSAATRLSQLMLAPPEGLADLQPQQKYLVIDQSMYEPEVLAEKVNLVAAIFRLERRRSSADIRDVLAKLARWLSHEKNATLRTGLTHWVVTCLNRQRIGANMPFVNDLTEVSEMYNRQFKTFEEEWEYEAVEKGKLLGKQEGLQLGKHEGLQAGQLEGRLAADRNRLQLLLIKRFHYLPAVLAARIGGASSAELDLWFSQLFDAASVEQIFEKS